MAKGDNPNSRANLQKGSNLAKLMYSDSVSQKFAKRILKEKVEYEGKMMTTREAILRQQVYKALEEGDLRSCQFLIELAGRNEQNVEAVKTATANPLEILQSMMQTRQIDDRRTKAN